MFKCLDCGLEFDKPEVKFIPVIPSAITSDAVYCYKAVMVCPRCGSDAIEILKMNTDHKDEEVIE